MNSHKQCIYCNKDIAASSAGPQPPEQHYYHCTNCPAYLLFDPIEDAFILSVLTFSNYTFYLFFKDKSTSVQWTGHNINFNVLLPVTPQNISDFIKNKLHLYLVFS